ARGTELRRALQSYWPQRASGGILRLYGMVADAYRLVGARYDDAYWWPRDGLAGQREGGLDGPTPRSLPFAQFRNGRAVALQPVRSEPIAPAQRGGLGEFVGAR